MSQKLMLEGQQCEWVANCDSSCVVLEGLVSVSVEPILNGVSIRNDFPNPETFSSTELEKRTGLVCKGPKFIPWHLLLELLLWKT